jgi:hypothetical protein
MNIDFRSIEGRSDIPVIIGVFTFRYDRGENYLPGSIGVWHAHPHFLEVIDFGENRDRNIRPHRYRCSGLKTDDLEKAMRHSVEGYISFLEHCRELLTLFDEAVRRATDSPEV